MTVDDLSSPSKSPCSPLEIVVWAVIEGSVVEISQNGQGLVVVVHCFWMTTVRRLVAVVVAAVAMVGVAAAVLWKTRRQ